MTNDSDSGGGDLTAPGVVHMFAGEAVCSDTVSGWLWYCDVHDSHGNADSQEEAEAVGTAHVEFQETVAGDDECDVMVWRRTRHERATGEGEGGGG